MRSKDKLIFISIWTAICCLPAAARFSYAQSPETTKENGGTKTAIEQALKSYEEKKKNEQEEVAAQLNFKLGQATEEWINLAENDKQSKLNTRLEQEWDKQENIRITTPLTYEYYLRDYNYSVADSDIVKTDSVTAPYKARVIIIEELYVEKYHHPDVSDSTLYYYTVTHKYTLNFEYRNNMFVLTDSNSKMVSKANQIPDNIRRQWL
jgi:hypothetical protein